MLLFVLPVSIFLLAGCGGKPKAKLIPAKGVVRINGKPAAGIMVRSAPVILDQEIFAPSSQGLTDEEGRFVLTSDGDQPGAYPGKHRISLFDTLEERPAQGEVASKPPRLDPKFATGAIEVTVSEGKDLEIEATGPSN